MLNGALIAAPNRVVEFPQAHLINKPAAHLCARWTAKS
jgi:hypothetical protein